MNDTMRTVHIIDDDAAVRDSLRLLLDLHGYAPATYASAEDFLAVVSPDTTGCVLADMRMPGMSGLELQTALQSRQIGLPVVVITAHGDVAAARTSFKNGALDFLEKPVDTQQLLAAVNAALDRDVQRRAESDVTLQKEALMRRLTEREREVLSHVLAGRQNREIGQVLGISARTAEAHKARLMAKLNVPNLPELVRLMQ